jgi:tubulin polyglutamylase TTLL4
LEQLIETLTPDDIRQLITAEDELSQCYNFYRIYPTTSTHTYTPYFELPRYYNMLFDAWETKYHADRPAAVERLKELCRQKIHLQVPVHAGSMVSTYII